MVDCILYQTGLWLHHLKESKVFEVSVLDTLALNVELLPYLSQVLAPIQLLDGTLETL